MYNTKKLIESLKNLKANKMQEKQLIKDYLADGDYDRLKKRLKLFNIVLNDLQICKLIESIK